MDNITQVALHGCTHSLLRKAVECLDAAAKKKVSKIYHTLVSYDSYDYRGFMPLQIIADRSEITLEEAIAAVRILIEAEAIIAEIRTEDD